MRNLLILTAVLLSSAASAQVSVQLRLATGQDTLPFGPNSCTGPVVVTWTRSGTACEQLSLWLTEGSCGDTPATGDVSLDSISVTTLQAQTTGNFQFQLSQLPFPNVDGGGGCGGLAEEKTFRLCGATKTVTSIYDATCGTVSKASGMKLVYDGKAPGAPTIESASGLDQAVRVTVSEPEGATRIELHVSRDGTEVKMVKHDVGTGDIRVEGLVNEVTYQLVAYAFDQAENQSAASESRDATPIKTNGLLEVYANAGGAETGGCGAAGGGVVGSAVLAALGFWLSSRRKRS